MEIIKTPELEVFTKSKNRLHTGAGRPALNLACVEKSNKEELQFRLCGDMGGKGASLSKVHIYMNC
jgi:hypothetical protein